MNIDAIKILKDKLDDGTFTEAQVLMICPEFKEQTELIELLDNPFVQEYNKLMAEVAEHLTIPDVQRYIELTVVKTTKGTHIGPKQPMNCLLCGSETHGAKWVEVKINGTNYHVGTITEACSKTTETRFQIAKGLTIEDMKKLNFPFSQGQLAGVYKKDTSAGLHKKD